jgi:hypothetical protein
VTDPLPEQPPTPHFRYRLPRTVAGRIRATARQAQRRRTVVVPAVCIFGRGAFLDDDPWRDGDRRAG